MNIKRFIIKHDKFMEKSLDIADFNVDWLIKYHESKICFLQQERKIHLLVTISFSFILLIIFFISLIEPNLYYYLVFYTLAILLIFYLFHYYLLENSVQRWYVIHQKLLRIKNKSL